MMTSHVGTFPHIVDGVIANWLNASQNTVVEYVPTEYFGGTHAESDLPTWPAKNHSGSLDGKDRSLAQTVLDGKIYFFPDPLTFDEGLIAEEKSHEIRIWNAGETSRTIQSIVGTNTEGTSLSHQATPQAFTPETDKTHTLTVNQTGPVQQYTTYTYTLDDATTVIVIVTGQRLQAFAYICAWPSGVKIKHLFQTAKVSSEKFVEQRRALFNKARLTQEVTFFFEDIRLQKLANDLKRFKGVRIGVPIYAERLEPATSPLLNATTVEFEESFADNWHLINHASMLIFFDSEKPELAEIKEIDSLDLEAKTITLKNSIKKDFNSATVVCFPVMLSATPVAKFGAKTGLLGVVTLVFEEIEA